MNTWIILVVVATALIVATTYIVYYLKHRPVHKPVYRIDVLKKANRYAETHNEPCLCSCICAALHYLDIYILHHTDIAPIFPLFTRENAMKFGARENHSFWWVVGDWEHGRMEFLDWLIEQYKDDKTDLRKL